MQNFLSEKAFHKNVKSWIRTNNLLDSKKKKNFYNTTWKFSISALLMVYAQRQKHKLAYGDLGHPLFQNLHCKFFLINIEIYTVVHPQKRIGKWVGMWPFSHRCNGYIYREENCSGNLFQLKHRWVSGSKGPSNSILIHVEVNHWATFIFFPPFSCFWFVKST